MNNKKKPDQEYMKEALDLAAKAYAEDEVPIGAVIIDDNGDVIGVGYNKTEQKCSQVFHAEVIALVEAGRFKNDWRLDGCVIFVTLEPCLMCIGAIKLSRIKKVVYGADSPVFGFRLDKDCFISLYNSDAFEIRSGVLQQECSDILKKFFQKKRIVSEGFKGEK